jgi:hypothetical protein
MTFYKSFLKDYIQRYREFSSLIHKIHERVAFLHERVDFLHERVNVKYTKSVFLAK